MPSYFRDSFEIKTLLTTLHLPHDAIMCTADATSMYTNIQTTPALHIISQYTCDNENTTISHYNADALIEALHINSSTSLLSLVIVISSECLQKSIKLLQWTNGKMTTRKTTVSRTFHLICSCLKGGTATISDLCPVMSQATRDREKLHRMH